MFQRSSDEEAFDANGSMTRLFGRSDGDGDNFAVPIAHMLPRAEFARPARETVPA